MEKPKALIQQYIKARDGLDAWVKAHYPEGKVLRWKTGRFKGRLCEVRRAHWDVDGIGDPKNFFSVMVLVRTFRIDGKQGFEGQEKFVDDNDHFHRIYRSIHLNFEEPSALLKGGDYVATY